MSIFFLLKTNYIKIATVLDLSFSGVLITHILGVTNKDNAFSFCGNDTNYTMEGSKHRVVFV